MADSEGTSDIFPQQSTGNGSLDVAAQRQLAGLAAPPRPPVEADLGEASEPTPVGYETVLQPGAAAPPGHQNDDFNEEPDEVRSRKPVGKLVFLLGCIGSVVGLVLLIVFGIKWTGGQNQLAVVTAASPSPAAATDSSATYKSQLALVDQQQQINKQSSPAPPTPSPSPSPSPKTSSTPPTRTVESSPVPFTAPPAVYRQPAIPQSVSQVSPVYNQPVIPPIDPYKRWATLAVLGDQSLAGSDQSQQAQPGDNGGGFSPGDVGSNPALASTPMPGAGSNPGLGGINSGVAANSPFPTVLLGTASPAPTLLVSDTSDAGSGLTPGSQGILNRVADPNSKGTPQSEVKSANPYEAMLNATVASNSSQQFGTSTGVGENPYPASYPSSPYSASGYSAQAQQSLPVVRLGTTVAGSVVVPLAWDLNQTDTNQPGQPSQTKGRFVVRIEQALVASNNEIALPAGSQLIVQATSVSSSNQLVQATVVAVVYDTPSGLRQQILPPDALVIRGESGSPLIANKLNDVGPALFQDDLLIGSLSALGKVGEILNQPTQQNTNVFNGTGLGSSVSNVNTSTTNNPQALPAALQGFGQTLSERLQQRSEQNTQALIAKNTIAVLPQGTRITIVVNSFFQIANQ